MIVQPDVGLTDRRVDGRTDGRTVRRSDGRTNRLTGGRSDGQTVSGTYGRMDGRMDEQMVRAARRVGVWFICRTFVAYLLVCRSCDADLLVICLLFVRCLLLFVHYLFSISARPRNPCHNELP
jgi:hypothetical protein